MPWPRSLLWCKKERVHRQDGAWSWLVCACAFVSNVLFIGFLLSIGVVIPVLMKEFQANREQAAWLGSMSIALKCLLGPIGCTLCDRFGCRFVAICGSFICIVSLLSSSFVPTLEFLYFTHGVLFGIGCSFNYSTPFLVVSQLFTKWRSLALCLITVGHATGMLIFGPLLQFMIDSFGWRITFRVMASVSVLGVVCGLTYSSKVVNQSNVDREPTSKDDCSSTSANHSRKMKKDQEKSENISTIVVENNNTSGKDDLRDDHKKNVYNNKGKCKEKVEAYFSVWRLPTYAVCTLSITLACVSEYNPHVILVKHAQELGFSADSVADLYSYLGIASIIFRVLAGVLLDFKLIKSRHLYQICLFANGTITLFMPMISEYYGLVVYVLVFGASNGIFSAVVAILVLESVEANKQGVALGMLLFLNAIALLLGPPLAGWIADIYNSYNPVFYMSGAISILAGLMVFLLHCWKNKATTDIEELSNEKRIDSKKVKNKDLKINLPSTEWALPQIGNRPPTCSYPAELAISIGERSLTNEMKRNCSNEENQELKQTTEVVSRSNERSRNLLVEFANDKTVLPKYINDDENEKDESKDD